MTFLILGAGSIGQRHFRNLIALDVPARDIAIVDTGREAHHWPEDLRGSHRAADRPWTADAVLICSPAQTHAHYIQRAVVYRRPFFVEKPAVLAIDDLSDEEWFTDVPHLVACNLRFQPEVRALQTIAKAVPSYDVSEWMVRSAMDTWPGRCYASVPFEFCHEIDLATWCFGEATIESVRKHDTQLAVTLAHKHARQSHIWIDPSTNAGRLGALTESKTGASVSYEWPSSRDLARMYRDELQHFLGVAQGRTASQYTLAQARHVVGLCAEIEAA